MVPDVSSERGLSYEVCRFKERNECKLIYKQSKHISVGSAYATQTLKTTFCEVMLQLID